MKRDASLAFVDLAEQSRESDAKLTQSGRRVARPARRHLLLIALATVVAGCVLAGGAITASAAAQPSITTDKADYKPGEVVHISGTGFVPGETYAMPVKRPDGSIVLVDPVLHFATPGWGFAVADAAGDLAYEYQLDGVAGAYEARAYPVTWSGDWTEAPVASVTFTDSTTDLEQCQNGKVGPPTVLDPCSGSNYANGNVNGAKAHWREGEFLAYRDTIGVDAAGTHVFQIHYDTVHSSTHALDYLGSFDATETTSPTATAFHANNNDPCSDVLPAVNCTPSAPADSFPIPAATLTNCNGSAGTSPAQIAGAFKIWGTNSPDITAVGYVAENVPSGGGNCSTSIAITFTTTGAGTVVLAWGGHIASEADWGNGNSASAINGSPYHTAQDSLTSNGVNQTGVGSQDAQLATSAVVFTPSIDTLIKDSQGNTVTSVSVGTTVHDTATLTGASSNAGGTVTYKRFTTIDCTGSSTDQNVTVTNGVVPDSSDFTPSTAGSYSYQAVYGGTNGPPQNLGATSPCEPLTVTAVAPTVTTAIHDASHSVVTSVPLGTTVHDSVTVSGSQGTATGNVTFDFFNNGTCSGTPAATSGNFALSGGSVDATTFTQGPLGAGSYAFMAHYAGAGNYSAADSPCEPLTVNQATPGLSTTVKDSGGNTVDDANPAALGTAVHDTAALSGQVGSFSFDGTATVTYSFFNNNNCSGTAASTENVTVAANGSVPDSTPQTLGAGDYSYQATYNGNDDYTSKTSDCEPFKVSQATPGLSTTVKDSGGNTVDNANPAALGAAVHDTAALSGQVGSFSFDGTATVTYSFFNNNNCSGTAASTENVTVAANGTVPDSSAQTLGAGDYSYQATYNGNANYSSKTSPCEPFKVSKATPGLSTTVKNGSGNTVDNTNPAPLGTPVHDTATLSGQVGSFSFNGTATVTYAFFKNNSCAGTPFSTENVTVAANGTVPDSAAQTLAAGDYSYQATYNGNANYSSKTSPCEPFKVSKATPGLTTTVKDGSGNTVDDTHRVAAGTAVHDTATLSGQVGTFSFNGTATVTYSFFTSHDCTGTPAGTQTVTVAANGSVPDSSPQTLAAGSYSYQATYSGNANYDPKTSACEPFIVVTPSSPFTPGYWKTHRAHTTRLLVPPITLGNYTVDTFAKATAVFNNMNCSSTQINSAIGCLAGHLLATKLNIKNLSDPCIQPVVDKADAFLKGQVVTYGGYTATGVNYIGPNVSYSMNNNKRNLAIALKNALDKYNNGGGC
jgi:hypothetical protein